MVVLDSASSNLRLTTDIVYKVIAPAIEAEYTSFQSAILCDGFKVHSKKDFKEHILNNYFTTNFLIMAGVITPKSQLLDKLINKIWKVFFCDEYDGFILAAPANEKIGQPIPPA